MKWKTCKGLQYVYFSNSLHQEQNCAVLCIIGMHSSMHNQAFFYRSTVTRLVHSISHKHRNPALTYSKKMFVVAKRSLLMSPSRVSRMSTCSLHYLNSECCHEVHLSKKTSVHSLMNITSSWSRWTVVKRHHYKKMTPNMACLTNTQSNHKLYMQTRMGSYTDLFRRGETRGAERSILRNDRVCQKLLIMNTDQTGEK